MPSLAAGHDVKLHVLSSNELNGLGREILALLEGSRSGGTLGGHGDGFG